MNKINKSGKVDEGVKQVTENTILPGLLLNSLNMEQKKLDSAKELSLEEFSETLKKGKEGRRFELLDMVEEGTLEPKDDFFFGISNQMYKEHKNEFKFGEHSYIAPLSLYRIFNNRKMSKPNDVYQYSNIEVSIGNGSNVQEIRAFQCFNKEKKVKITIGDNSSCAHNVGFVSDNVKDSEPAEFTIGSNVFIGINSTLKENIVIESGENGNYTTVGFGCQLNAGCKIGSGCIIGDGSIIYEGVEIPKNTVVLPGTHVDQNMVDGDRETKSMTDFLTKDLKEQQAFRGLLDLGTRDIETENRNKLKKVGPSLSFLNRFNDHVLEDNQAFPTMYRLIKKYHPEHNNVVKHGGGEFVNVDLPKGENGSLGKDEFLHHYYLESLKAKEDKNYEIKPYPGEFTKVEIDENVEMADGAIMYNIGETKIKATKKGSTKIKGLVINRSGDEGGSLEIIDSDISHGVVSHAKGAKKIENSVINRWCIIHGATTLDNMNLQDNIVMHNVTAKNGTVGSRATLVGVRMDDTNVGKSTRMLGHEKGIDTVGSCIPQDCVIRDGSRITNTSEMDIGYIGQLNEQIGIEA